MHPEGVKGIPHGSGALQGCRAGSAQNEPREANLDEVCRRGIQSNAEAEGVSEWKVRKLRRRNGGGFLALADGLNGLSGAENGGRARRVRPTYLPAALAFGPSGSNCARRNAEHPPPHAARTTRRPTARLQQSPGQLRPASLVGMLTNAMVIAPCLAEITIWSPYSRRLRALAPMPGCGCSEADGRRWMCVSTVVPFVDNRINKSHAAARRRYSRTQASQAIASRSLTPLTTMQPGCAVRVGAFTRWGRRGQVAGNGACGESASMLEGYSASWSAMKTTEDAAKRPDGKLRKVLRKTPRPCEVNSEAN